MRTLLLGLSLSGLLIATSAQAVVKQPSTLAADQVTVKTAHIRLVKNDNNGAEVLMELDNAGNRTQALVAANSPEATQTLLQRTIYGKTRPVARIFIGPKGHEKLQPGGFHIMLLGLKQTLRPGDSVPLLLIFADGSSMTVRATVDK